MFLIRFAVNLILVPLGLAFLIIYCLLVIVYMFIKYMGSDWVWNYSNKTQGKSKLKMPGHSVVSIFGKRKL